MKEIAGLGYNLKIRCGVSLALISCPKEAVVVKTIKNNIAKNCFTQSNLSQNICNYIFLENINNLSKKA